MLDLSLSLSNEVPMMHHMINGDGPQQVSLSSQTSYQQPLILKARNIPPSYSNSLAKAKALELPLVRDNEHVISAIVLQVILVQVNPGETFTIRTEDGALQCIQGLSNEDLHNALTVQICEWIRPVWKGINEFSQQSILRLVCLFGVKTWRYLFRMFSENSV